MSELERLANDMQGTLDEIDRHARLIIRRVRQAQGSGRKVYRDTANQADQIRQIIKQATDNPTFFPSDRQT